MAIVYSRPNATPAPRQILDYTRLKPKQEPLVNTDPFSEEKIIKEYKARQAAKAAGVTAEERYKAVLSAEEQAVYDAIAAEAVPSPLGAAPTPGEST